MNAFRHVFDPLHLEIIDHVYEAAWARVEAQRPLHNSDTEQLKKALRKRVMIYAATGQFDFDTLYDRVSASLSEHRLNG